MSEPFKPFSERYGYTQTDLPQREVMDDALRTGLWNAFYTNFPDTVNIATYILDSWGSVESSVKGV